MHQALPARRIRYNVIAIILPLGIWSATIGLLSFDPVVGNIDIKSGGATFRNRCGACHLLEKGVTTHHGPNLYDIGRIAGTRKPDLTAAQYILESILDPGAFVAPQNSSGMPKSVVHELSSDAIRNLVAFLSSRGARPDYKEIMRLKIPKQTAPSVRTVRRQDMELAELVLRKRGKCLECHSLHKNAEHRVFAPALFEVGLVDEQVVRESILDPNKVMSPDYAGVNVFLEDGQVISGRLISQTDERLVLLARDEQYHPVRLEVAMSEIEEEDGQPMIQASNTSAMPTGLNQLLTPEELEAVILMIGQLNR